MKVTETYHEGCKWCNATGITPNPQMGLTTTITVQCPVCNGTKVIPVVREYETQDAITYKDLQDADEAEASKMGQTSQKAK